MVQNPTKKFPRFLQALLMLAILFVNVNQSYAQYPEKLRRFNLTFESPVNLHKYLTLSELHVFGWENDDYAVDLEVFKLNKRTEDYYRDVKLATRDVAKYLAKKVVAEGEALKNISESYYVVGEREDHMRRMKPVIVLVILNRKKKRAFEITIDCYNDNLAVGKQILNSFKFTK
jgi:hypothetical protein